MLSAIGRLYSEAYDLPTRSTEPEKRYMVATMPRSGSTHFCIQLWRQGVFGAPLEYINLPRLEGLIDRLGGGDIQRYWRAVQRVRATPNGVFGYKTFVPDFKRLMESHSELLPSVASDHVIYLTRRDWLAQAISLTRAAQTNVWFADMSSPIVAEYDFARIGRMAHILRDQKRSWEMMFQRTGTTPIRIFHEDVLADFAGVSAQIAEAMGVGLESDRRLDIPQLRRQSDATSAEWRSRFLEDCDKRCIPRPAEPVGA